MSITSHIGHQVEINRYGKMADLECLTCRQTIETKQVETPIIQEPVPVLQVCNMDEGCEACGS